MSLADFTEEEEKPRQKRPSALLRTPLFDAHGVPWTSRLSLGWTYFIFVTFGAPLGPFLGLYLGLWLVAKRRSVESLLVYLALIGCAVAAFLPSVPHDVIPAQVFAWVAVGLWFAGAFLLRDQVVSLYRETDRTHLNPSYVLTALFGPWYINYQLRPMWPV